MFLPARHHLTSPLLTLSKQNKINTVNMKGRNGWDGKLRVDDPDNRRAVLANPEALEDPDYSDEDAPPVEEIGADEGISLFASQGFTCANICICSGIDLLEDEDPDAEVRFVICGVASSLEKSALVRASISGFSY
jgi:hypothetical protein